jgi:hypothetical protein
MPPTNRVMKLKAGLLAILFNSMIGLAACADGPSRYEPYGYPNYGYYDRGPWWWYGHRDFAHRDFDHLRHFEHDRSEGRAFGPSRFGGAGFHNGLALARGGGFRGGFGRGHFGGEGGHR